MMAGDREKMVAIGIVWGATNALIRRGALLWDHKTQNSSSSPTSCPKLHQKLLSSIKNWLSILLFWQYSVPFLLNLSASATFFAILSDSPISLAVPVTNATTFAATAVFGMLLGEDTQVGFALLVGIAQLAIGGECPPVSWGVGSTLTDANWSIPLASPCPKIAVSCYEWCNFPINLNSPTLSCPVISIPQAGVNPHALFVWELDGCSGGCSEVSWDNESLTKASGRLFKFCWKSCAQKW